jgi:hypothetical protein
MGIVKSLLRRFRVALRRWWREPMPHDTAAKIFDDRSGT